MAGLPERHVLSLAVSFGLLSFLVMAFLSSRQGRMVHCFAFCPMGLMSNLFGRISPWRISIDKDCNQCGRCSKVCRYNALTKEDLQRGRPGFTCSLCGDCLSTCRHNHLKMTFLKYSFPVIKTIFICLVVSLHAVFLGVARM
jgi:polyferredoxin